MLKKILKKEEKEKKINKEKELLAIELSEIKEISEMIFERIDKKIAELKAIESSIDEKATKLEILIQRAESIKPIPEGRDRRHEIFALKQRGLKIDEIAEILDIPSGEVELIINLYPDKK